MKSFKDQAVRAAPKAFDIVDLAARALDELVRRSLLADPSAEFARRAGERAARTSAAAAA